MKSSLLQADNNVHIPIYNFVQHIVIWKQLKKPSKYKLNSHTKRWKCTGVRKAVRIVAIYSSGGGKIQILPLNFIIFSLESLGRSSLVELK